MGASLDNKVRIPTQELDSAVEMGEHARRPGASPTSIEAIHTGAYTTIHEKAAMQPITSLEASQISMPLAPASQSHEASPVNSQHSLTPQGVDIISGKVGYTKNLALVMMENGHAIVNSMFQTVKGGLGGSSSNFQPVSTQPTSNAPSSDFHGIGSPWQQGKNPLSVLVDKMVRSIVDLLF